MVSQDIVLLSQELRRLISGDIEWTATQFREFINISRRLCDVIHHYATIETEGLKFTQLQFHNGLVMALSAAGDVYYWKPSPNWASQPNADIAYDWLKNGKWVKMKNEIKPSEVL